MKQSKTTIHNLIEVASAPNKINPGDLLKFPNGTMAVVLSGQLAITKPYTKPKQPLQLLWKKQTWSCWIEESKQLWDIMIEKGDFYHLLVVVRKTNKLVEDDLFQKLDSLPNSRFSNKTHTTV